MVDYSGRIEFEYRKIIFMKTIIHHNSIPIFFINIEAFRF